MTKHRPEMQSVGNKTEALQRVFNDSYKDRKITVDQAIENTTARSKITDKIFATYDIKDDDKGKELKRALNESKNSDQYFNHLRGYLQKN